jgi:hypothetical protein
MLITHKIKKLKVSKDVSNTLERGLSLFLVSRRGHYFALSANPKDAITNFTGWFNAIGSSDGFTLYKTVDNIYIDKDPTELINNFTNIERRSSEVIENFVIAKNGLIYNVSSYHGLINIDLDFRGIYDSDDKGRIYKIYKLEGMNILLVEYTKYRDESLKEMVKKSYLAIKGANFGYTLKNTWSHKYYHYDAYRKNDPERYVYNALQVLCKKNVKLYFGFSDDKEEAISKVNDISDNDEKIGTVYDHYIENVIKTKSEIHKVTGPEVAMAYANCVHAIDGLLMHLQVDHKKVTGLWAGLPWFHQYWARDELISMQALILEHRYESSKEIILRYLSDIKIDGRLSNRYPSTELGNADGIGWLFKRIYDYMIICEQRNNFDVYFTLYDLKYIRERLQFTIKSLLKNYSKEGLLINGNLETWMDTYFNGSAYNTDYREGARIEIQTLFLNMLKLMNLLNNYLANKFVKKHEKLVSITDNQYNYKKLEEDTTEIVRNKFFKGVNGLNVLNDGYDCTMSEIVRPNIFLAYYLYPELVSPKDWESTFDNALSKLWCEWDIDTVKCGGLSTIDKSNGLYQPYYTGIDNKSYHRGDSWFWINNLAAIAMYRLNKEKYDTYIQKIMHASTQDILYWGFIGYASELASSGWFKSGGCLCQTWSITTFIELIHEMYIE